MAMRFGGPETVFDEVTGKWGVANERKPVPGTFHCDSELSALALACKLFPHDTPCLTRDNYHTTNEPNRGDTMSNIQQPLVLVDPKTGAEVRLGTWVETSRGTVTFVTGVTEPRNEFGHGGRVHTPHGSFFASVVGLEWWPRNQVAESVRRAR